MSEAQATLEAEIKRLADKGRGIALQAQKAGRGLTTAEAKQVTDLLVQAQALKARVAQMQDNDNTLSLIDRAAAQVLGGSTPTLDGRKGGTFSAALKAAGYDRRTNPVVVVDYKGVTFDGFESDGDIANLAPAIRRPGVPLGADERFAYVALRSQGMDNGTTAIPGIRQSSRDLGVNSAGDGLREVDSVEPKHEVKTSVEVVTVPVQQVAHIETEVPNILLESELVRSFIDQDLQLAYRETLDANVVASLEAVFTATGAPGANLIEEIVFAAAAVVDAGYAPDTLIASPEDLLALALTPDIGTGDYLAGKMDALLSGLKKVASKSISTPMVLDSTAAGILYLSPVRFATFEENAGSTNTSTVRCEGNFALSIERSDAGAVTGGLSSS